MDTKQMSIKFQNNIHELAKRCYREFVFENEGYVLMQLVKQNLINDIEICYPGIEYFLDFDLFEISLSEKRDNRIDQVLDGSEARREIEILITIRYKLFRGDDVKIIAIHLNENSIDDFNPW